VVVGLLNVIKDLKQQMKSNYRNRRKSTFGYAVNPGYINVFLPGQSFVEEGFLDKLGSQEYTDREVKNIKFKREATQANFRFTEMEGGYLGMASRFSHPGDVVAILKGCRVPLILRKHKDHYIIIGTSSIPGLMEGEAKELFESWRARFEDIQIR
jgi:hypothetical protein